MASPWRLRILACLSAGIGISASTGHPVGIALMCLMPALAAAQDCRRHAFIVAAAYLAGATWPMIPGARNFFGPRPGAIDAVALWIAAVVLLAAPWAVVWTVRRYQLLWRVPLGLALTAVPPLGIIGVASPLSSAGLLFPGTAWLGLIATAVLPVTSLIKPKWAIPAVAALAIISNAFWKEPRPVHWDAVDTNLGVIAHENQSLGAQFAAMQWLQERAVRSSSKVVIFPETAVRMWTAATESFWEDTLARLRADGKTLVIGVGLPGTDPVPFDFSAELAALGDSRPVPGRAQQREAASFRNGALLRGSETGTFVQRIPVPLGMWHPFRRGGVPLNVAGRGTIVISGERAAIWICYEHLLVWPVLESMLERPTVIVAMANDYWAAGTTVPRCQASMVSAWARLFGLPYVSSVNR
jgi:hypothetical protein